MTLLGFGWLALVWAPPILPSAVTSLALVVGTGVAVSVDPQSVNVERDLPRDLTPETAARAEALRHRGRLTAIPMVLALGGGFIVGWFRNRVEPFDQLLAATCTLAVALCLIEVVRLRKRFRALILEAKQVA